MSYIYFFLMIRRPPRSTRFPYTTLSRSVQRPHAPRGPRRERNPPQRRRRRPARRRRRQRPARRRQRSEEHTSELQSRQYIVCRLLLEKTKKSYVVTIFKEITRTKLNIQE